MFGLFRKKDSIDLELLTEKQIVQLVKENGFEKGGDILREAANRGNLPSQCFLSIMYLKELDKNHEEKLIRLFEENAEYFTKLAAKQSDIDSQFNLGKFYLSKGFKKMNESNGHYTKESKDFFNKAEFWYRAAAKQGHKIASEALNDLAETFEISKN